MHLKILLIFFVLCASLHFQCTTDVNPSDQSLKALSLTIVDSIPLFKDSLVFEYYDIHSTEDKMLLYGSNSGIYELDLETNELTEVCSLGNGPGQIKLGLFTARYLPDDRIVVAEILSYGRFYLFDRNHKLVFVKKHSEIFPSDSGMAPFVCSNIDVLDVYTDSLLIGMGVNVHTTEVPDWEREDCYSKLVVNDNEVKFHSSHFPLEQNEFISRAVEQNLEYSPFIVPRVDSEDDKIYLSFLFDKDIYITDRRLNIISKKSFSIPYRIYNYAVKFNENSSRKDNINQNFSNLFIESFDFYNGKAFITYPKPIPPEETPNSIEEIRNRIKRDRIIHVMDIKTDQEYICDLPIKVDGQNMVIKSDSIIFLLGNKNFQEDTFIYKVSMNF